MGAHSPDTDPLKIAQPENPDGCITSARSGKTYKNNQKMTD